MPKAQTAEERRAILNALSAQDGEVATRVLVDWLKDAPSRHSAIVDDPHQPLYEQLWRTGRSAETGLCVGGTRPVPELARSASDGSIGTAHPFIFEDVASDGSWVDVCQARQDTTGDGVIQVSIGHHGDVLGDEMQPYLIVGTGTGLAVDELLGNDLDGQVRRRPPGCLSGPDRYPRTYGDAAAERGPA